MSEQPRVERRMTSMALRVALSLLVAAALIHVLFRWGGLRWSDVTAALGGLSPEVYLAALACHAALYCVRAVRFQLLLSTSDRPSFPAQLSVGMAQTMASIIMPAKLGELMYVLYSNRVFGLRAETSLAVLFLSRLFDLAALGVAMGAVCLALAPQPAMPSWLYPVGITALVGGFALLLLTLRGSLFTSLLRWCAQRVGGARTSLGTALIARLQSAGQALDAVRGPSVFWRCAGLSVLAWLCIFAFCGILGRGLGLPETIGPLQAVFGAALAILTSLIPVSAFASIGTLEAGWVLGF
ncbi:MAG: lysylphosphatidylglycerol synthase transmembrane domain-containing protein, partial [Planctomycetia bacterium]